MGNDLITHIGIGGVFAVVVLREVFNFLKNGKSGSSSNTVSRDEFDRHKGQVQYKDNCVEVVKRFEDHFGGIDKQFQHIDKQFGEVKELIRNGH